MPAIAVRLFEKTRCNGDSEKVKGEPDETPYVNNGGSLVANGRSRPVRGRWGSTLQKKMRRLSRRRRRRQGGYEGAFPQDDNDGCEPGYRAPHEGRGSEQAPA